MSPITTAIFVKIIIRYVFFSKLFSPSFKTDLKNCELMLSVNYTCSLVVCVMVFTFDIDFVSVVYPQSCLRPNSSYLLCKNVDSVFWSLAKENS